MGKLQQKTTKNFRISLQNAIATLAELRADIKRAMNTWADLLKEWAKKRAEVVKEYSRKMIGTKEKAISVREFKSGAEVVKEYSRKMFGTKEKAISVREFKSGIEELHEVIAEANEHLAATTEEYSNLFEGTHFESSEGNKQAAKAIQSVLNRISHKVVDPNSGRLATVTHRKGCRNPYGRFELRYNLGKQKKSGQCSSTYPKITLAPTPRREQHATKEDIEQAYRANSPDEHVDSKLNEVA